MRMGRVLVVTFLIAAVGVAACVVRTRPIDRGRPVIVEQPRYKAEKHKPKKHKKHHDRD
jgi:hypothetical protein